MGYSQLPVGIANRHRYQRHCFPLGGSDATVILVLEPALECKGASWDPVGFPLLELELRSTARVSKKDGERVGVAECTESLQSGFSMAGFSTTFSHCCRLGKHEKALMRGQLGQPKRTCIHHVDLYTLEGDFNTSMLQTRLSLINEDAITPSRPSNSTPGLCPREPTRTYQVCRPQQPHYNDPQLKTTQTSFYGRMRKLQQHKQLTKTSQVQLRTRIQRSQQATEEKEEDKRCYIHHIPTQIKSNRSLFSDRNKLLKLSKMQTHTYHIQDKNTD